LENNDLSRWPSGLFRRAFVRSYAEAIGLDPEEVCRRFVRLFPEHEGDVPEMRAVPPPPPAPATPSADTPRLTLADEESTPTRWPLTLSRLAAVAVDLSIAAVPAAAAGSLVGGAWFWITAALVGAVGHAVALSAWGRTPGALLFLPDPAPVPDEAARKRHVRAETEGPVLVASRNAIGPANRQAPGVVRAAPRRRR
jgi:hypothetical protein